jgi:hypothetical protein
MLINQPLEQDRRLIICLYIDELLFQWRLVAGLLSEAVSYLSVAFSCLSVAVSYQWLSVSFQWQ